MIDKVIHIAETLIHVQENAEAKAIGWDIVCHRRKEVIIAVAVQCDEGTFQVWVILNLETGKVEAS